MRAKPSPDFIVPLSSGHSAPVSRLDTPKNERDLCIQTAATVAARGHMTEAIALYEQAEKLDASGKSLDRELAPLYAQAGQSDQSLMRYQKAIANNPKDEELRNNHAWTLLEWNRVEEAIETLESAREKFPNNRRLQSTQAIAMYRRGDRAAALAQFTALYGASAAQHNLAMLDIEAGDAKNATVAVNTALRDTPSSKTIQLATAIQEFAPRD